MTSTLHRNVLAACARMDQGTPRRRCDEAPGDALLHAIDQFNRREFFECHETLEELWLAETDDIRFLYQGVLQIGVGYLHLLRGNHHGAVTKLHSGAALLEYFGPACLGLDVHALLETSREHAAILEQLGPERLGELDRGLIPTIHVAERSGR